MADGGALDEIAFRVGTISTVFKPIRLPSSATGMKLYKATESTLIIQDYTQRQLPHATLLPSTKSIKTF